MNDEVLINRIKLAQKEETYFMNKNNIVKNNIINLAEKKNKKHNEIAKAINMQSSNFSRALNNDSTSFTDKQLTQIANFLNVNAQSFLTEYEYIKITGIVNHCAVQWFLPFQEQEYLRASSQLTNYINESPNESSDVKLQALRIGLTYFLQHNKKGKEYGKSIKDQYLIYDSSRTQPLDDCQNYFCVIQLAQTFKQHNKKDLPFEGESFCAEVVLDNDYVLCAPEHKPDRKYRIHKENITLCSPIFFRTMHKNVIKKASEIKEKF